MHLSLSRLHLLYLHESHNAVIQIDKNDKEEQSQSDFSLEFFSIPFGPTKLSVHGGIDKMHDLTLSSTLCLHRSGKTKVRRILNVVSISPKVLAGVRSTLFPPEESALHSSKHVSQSTCA